MAYETGQSLITGHYFITSHDGLYGYGEYESLDEAEKKVMELERADMTEKHGPGRPRMPVTLRKVPINTRLPLWIVERLRAHPEPISHVIERCVCHVEQWEAPK